MESSISHAVLGNVRVEIFQNCCLSVQSLTQPILTASLLLRNVRKENLPNIGASKAWGEWN